MGSDNGPLPAATEAVAYELEYGEAELHVHTDAIPAGARVLVHDDLIATGAPHMPSPSWSSGAEERSSRSRF